MIKLFIGLNDKDTGKQKISTRKAKRIINNICYDALSGATIQQAQGIYKHDSGRKVKENTITVETSDKNILTLIDKIKVLFNQESIAIQETQDLIFK